MPKSPDQAPKAQEDAPDVKRDENEGEGNKSAARRYDAGVQKTVKSGRVPQKAREAAQALDGPEGAELRRAEEEAKRGKAK